MLQYHFRTKEGPSLGPIGADEFRQRLEDGDICDETMVWQSGMLDWTTYANLRAIEEQAAQPPPLPVAMPPPLPTAKESHHAAARPAVQFLACAGCGQDWPENLLNLQGAKQICGNCIRKQGDIFKNGHLKNHASGVSSGWGAWLVKTLALAVLCTAIVSARLWLRSEARRGGKVLRYELNAKDRTFTKLPPREAAPAGAP